jgi:hypothetical protein
VGVLVTPSFPAGVSGVVEEWLSAPTCALFIRPSTSHGLDLGLREAVASRSRVWKRRLRSSRRLLLASFCPESQSFANTVSTYRHSRQQRNTQDASSGPTRVCATVTGKQTSAVVHEVINPSAVSPKTTFPHSSSQLRTMGNQKSKVQLSSGFILDGQELKDWTVQPWNQQTIDGGYQPCYNSTDVWACLPETDHEQCSATGCCKTYDTDVCVVYFGPKKLEAAKEDAAEPAWAEGASWANADAATADDGQGTKPKVSRLPKEPEADESSPDTPAPEA